MSLPGRVRLLFEQLRYRRRRRRRAGQRLIAGLLRVVPEGVFVVVGANDGHQDEHLDALYAEPGWGGVMVEPEPSAVARLAGNFGDRRNIALANVAVADRDGRLPLYGVEPPRAAAAEDARWELFGTYDLVSSLSRETILGHDWIAGVEDRITVEEVECLRFESLCDRYEIERIDCLLIDAEGYDLEILEGIDFPRHRPRLLIYEHFHLGGQGRARAREIVAANGYESIEEGWDTWCLDRSPDDALSALFPELVPVSIPGLAEAPRS
jgi:FkbM family methyltransferase